MTSITNELLKDPLFQLNAVLWLSQPLPEEHEISPLLNRQGFVVYAIAPLLSLPPDLRLEAQTARISMKEGVRPDVVLTLEKDRKFAFIECKASSFSTESLKSEKPDQSRSLLIIAGPRSAEILGLPAGQISSSLLGYVIPETEHDLMTQTLVKLQKELHSSRLPVGQFTVLGLLMRDVDVSIVVNDLGSNFFALTSGTNPFLKREPDTDPRPLYFIPYDPDLIGQQTDEEKLFCKRVLFERMLSTIITAVGRANPPTEVPLKSRDVLNDAMFGMYEHWENSDSARHMRKLCSQFMDALMKAVESVAPGIMAFQPKEGWGLSLKDQDQQEKIIDALTRFSCESLDLRTEPPPDLFDDLEDGGPAGTGT